MKKVKVAIFISDVGFGHMVRQREIIRQLFKSFKNLEITVINFEHIEILKENFGKKINYKKKYNNITLFKDKNSFFDLKKSKKFIQKWPKSFFRTKKFIKKNFAGYSFFISDYVPEVFKIAKELNVPAFGVCHYTWGWYFSKILNSKSPIIKRFKEYEFMATKNYFPPFTPAKILTDFKKQKFKNVGFVIKKMNIIKKKTNKKTFLLMDNGTKTLNKLISKIIPLLSKNNKYNFYIGINSLDNMSKKIITESKNLYPVIGLKSIYSCIKKVDHVIVRGGFNSITECLVFKKPSIFMNEKFNPEIEANIKIIVKKKIGAIIKPEDWGINFIKKIEMFLKKDSKIIENKLSKLNLNCNGAKEIVEDIKKEIRLKNKLSLVKKD